MLLKPTETFQPAIDMDEDDCLEHGVSMYEFPSDSAIEVATRRLAGLVQTPLTVGVFTDNQHDFMLELQHRFAQGYYVAGSSPVSMSETKQVAILFKPLKKIQGE